MTDIGEAFWAIGRSDFALLTTFRRTGVGVATTVWVTRHEDHLVVTTPATSGKVKRLRNDERVLLAPCGRLGRVRLGAPVVHARGKVLGPDDEHPGAVTALRRDYGLQYRLVLAVERAARRRRGGDGTRVIIALEPAVQPGQGRPRGTRARRAAGRRPTGGTGPAGTAGRTGDLTTSSRPRGPRPTSSAAAPGDPGPGAGPTVLG